MFPRAYTLLYITRRACPALAIKIFQRFPLCYYYIESMRFCQAFQELIIFPNMTGCTNTKCSIHSKRPGHSKHSRQPSRRFFRRRPYIPAPESWPSAPILRQRKVEGYCTSRRMEDIHIYNVYIQPFSPESVQPKNKRRRSQTGTPRTTR